MNVQQLISDLKKQINHRDWFEPETKNDEYGIIINGILPKNYLQVCELENKMYLGLYTVTIDGLGRFEFLYDRSEKIEDFAKLFYEMLRLNKR